MGQSNLLRNLAIDMPPRSINTKIVLALIAATSSTVIATATAAFCGSFIVLRSADTATFVTTINNEPIGWKMRSTVSKSILGGVIKETCCTGGRVIKKAPVVQWSMMSTTSSYTSTSTFSSSATDSLFSGVPAATTSPHSHRRRTLQPLVVCGPSGVGKGTIISRFMEIVNRKENEDGNESSSSSSSSSSIPGERHHSLPEFKFSVSHTTRLPRNGEIHGVHYHFVTKEYMLSKLNGNCGNEINDREDRNNNNFFVEYAQVHGNLYGTSFQSIYDASSSSSMSEKEDLDARRRECLLDIDVKGVRSIKEFQLRQTREIVQMISPMNNMNIIRLGKERSTQQYVTQPPNPPPVSNNNNSCSSHAQQLPLLDPKFIFIAPPTLEVLRERLSNRNTETPESLELRLRNAGEEMDYGMTAGNFDAVIVNDDLDRACEEFIKVVAKLYEN